MKIKENYAKEFFWVCFKIGIGILVYRYGIDYFSSGALILVGIVQVLFSDVKWLVNLVAQLSTGVASVLAFAIGAAVLFILLRKGKRKNYQRIHKRVKLPWTAPFMIIAVVAINFVMAELNAYIISYISSDTLTNLSMPAFGSGVTFVEIIAMMFATAVVPAICEEIAFRGLILTNLEPYGKGTAILGSALLFGLMHMNPAQFFYTTVMGMMLGLVYVKTKSIWLCMVIHFVNNTLGVLQEILFYAFEMDIAIRIISIMTVIVVALGIVSAVILVIARCIEKKRAPAEIGSFGRICEADFGYEAHPVTKSKKIKLFFGPTILVFTGMVFESMAMTALLYVISFIIPSSLI